MTEKQLNSTRIWSLIMSEDKKDKKEAAKMVKEFIDGYLKHDYKDLISMDDLVILESLLILDGMIKVGKEKDTITRLYSNLAPIIMKRLNGDKGNLYGLMYQKFYQPIKELREFAEKKGWDTEVAKISFIQSYALIEIDKDKALLALDESIGVVPNNCVESLKLYINNYDYKYKFVDANDTEFYIGELNEDGAFNGFGTYYFDNGARYVGNFVNDVMEGEGTYYYANGEYESGRFVDGQFWKGNLKYKKLVAFDNGFYEGEFQHEKRNGYGIYVWDSGARYEGEWKDSNMHGIGTYYYADGTKEVGLWENDKFVGPVNEQKFTLSELIKATCNPTLFINPKDRLIENSCEYYGQFVEKMKEHYNSGWAADATEILAEITNIDFNEIAMPLIDILGDVGSVGFETYFLTALQVVRKKISFGEKPFANLCYYMYKHNFIDEWTNDDFIWCYFESRASKSSGPESLWFERLLANNDVHKPVTPDAEKRNIYIFNEEEYGKELDNYLRKDFKMSSNLELKPRDFFE